MIKRMADRLGNLQLGHGHQSKSQTYLSSQNAPIHPDAHVVASTSTLSLEHRASISTSISEWSKTTAAATESSDALLSMDVDQSSTQARRRTKPKGTYRLTDFVIQRTLGCGSFGRVHLGERCIASEWNC
jgi:protein kinase A